MSPSAADDAAAGGHVPGDRAAARGRLLVVDDEPLLARAMARLLIRVGYEVGLAHDGEAALGELGARRYDALFLDIGLPRRSGIDVLRHLRAADPELPVVLMTGVPTLESAIEAVAQGAFRYLVKPVEPATLQEAARDAVERRRRVAAARAAAHGALAINDGDARAELEHALDAVTLAYQPIVSWSARAPIGHEVLAWTAAPPPLSPGDEALAALAGRAGALPALGRHLRARLAAALDDAGAAARTPLFLDLRALDLSDRELYQPRAPLSRHAGRVVLTITERAALRTVADLGMRLGELRRLGYRVAIDDYGDGHGGPAALARLEPDYVKLDGLLVRDLDRRVAERRIVRATVQLCRELGAEVIAEGVERAGEREALLAAGCDLFRGRLFGAAGPSLT